jgi:hypothetical protein
MGKELIMYYAIVGLGPNELEIPLLFFTNREEAEILLNMHFEYRQGTTPELDSWRTDDGQVFVEQDEHGCNEPTAKAGILFKDRDYYGGCGDCWALKIVEVEEGKPIVGWDLD